MGDLPLDDRGRPSAAFSERLLAEQGQGVADRRERVAQFVREHRNEFVLAAVGFGEGGVRLPQRLRGAPLVGDVAEHHHGAHDLAGGIAEGTRAEPTCDPITSGLDDLVHLVLDGLTLEDSTSAWPFFRCDLTAVEMVALVDLAVGGRRRCVGRPAPELVETGVAQQDFAGSSSECDGKRRLFDEGPQSRVALAQRLLGRWRLHAPALVFTSGGVGDRRRDVAGDRILQVLRPSFRRPEGSGRPVEGTHPRPHLAAARDTIAIAWNVNLRHENHSTVRATEQCMHLRR
jgi:hypothetical protein